MAQFLGPNDEVGWDGNGQLLSLRYKKGTDILRRFEYTYDDAGNRISQLDVKGVGTTKATKWEYGYDWLASRRRSRRDRLETVKKAEASTVGGLGALQLVSVYTYDAADNRHLFEVPNLSNPALTETFRYSYDDADSIEQIEKKVGSGAYSVIETFDSDDDGNLLTRVSGGVTTTYIWDDFNRLAAISTSDNSKKQSHTFGVNGFRRKKKDKNDVETTEYAAGLATAVSKVEAAETITYLMGHGLMGLERSDGAMFYFLTDALSTVRDVVRGTDGAVMASYEFSEYGQKISPANTQGVESQKTFVGGMSVQDEVADTGLMLMGHRFYDPGIGRFLNRDPIGFRGGMNLFEYSRSSPTRFTDPTGLLSPTHEPTIYEVHVDGSNGNHEEGYQFRMEVNKTVLATVYEPADWYFTAEDAYNNGFSYWHGLALIPILSYPLMKSLKSLTSVDNVVYRGLSKTDVPESGFVATNPCSNMSLKGHVMGGYKNSPWISTTKSKEIASGKYGEFGYAKIDLGKVTNPIVDLSRGFPQFKKWYTINRRVLKDAEVLIYQFIPPEAVIEVHRKTQ